jgi:hypothetical protein
MLQTSFYHLTLQLIGVLLNGWVHHEFMIPRSIGFDLLPNVFVIANEPFVGHIFNAHISNSSHPVIAGGYPASVRLVGNRTFAEQNFAFCVMH